jgi:Dynamin family
MSLERFALFSAANAVSSITQFINASRQIKAQKELEAIRQQATAALADAQHERAKELFEMARQKELEIIQIQFENQVEFAERSAQQWRENREYTMALDQFPLKLVPAQVYEFPQTLVVVTRHAIIRAIDEVAKDEQISHLDRTNTLDADLSLFLQKSGYYANHSTHSTQFLNGSWKNYDLSGESAAKALYSFLKGRSALFIEYQDILSNGGRAIIVNVAHWQPDPHSYRYFTFSHFTYQPGDVAQVNRRILALHALAVGTVADMKALSESLSLPLLLGRLPEIIGTGDDEVIAQAVRSAVQAYRSALSDRWQTTPETVTQVTIEVAKQLALASGTEQAQSLLKELAEEFLKDSLEMFVLQRGGTARTREVSELLDQAARRQLPDDADYFALARSLRAGLKKAELESLLRIKVSDELPAEMTFANKLQTIRATLSGLKLAIEGFIAEVPNSDSQALEEFAQVAFLNHPVPEVLRKSRDGRNMSNLQLLSGSLQHSLNNLKCPTLRIVSVSRTSAGKSTFFGALIGRALVPVASGEMSMGILRLIHAPGGLVYRKLRRSLDHQEESLEAEEKGYKSILDDEKIVDDIEKTMLAYVPSMVPGAGPAGAAKNHDAIPIFEVKTPLLIGNFKELISLPPEANVEVHDLPGLNNTNNDDRNLALIQEQIRNSFCIFFFDWTSPEVSRDSNLLEAVKTMLSQTGADPESVIYVLNKFDERDDKLDYVAERIREFKETLRIGLQLKEPPEILPTCGISWFRTQVAWGPSAIDEPPSSPPAIREKWLKAYARDPKGLRLLDDEDPRMEWFQDNLTVRKAARLSDDDFRKLMNEIVYPVSGARAFLQCLSDRLQRRCVSLIIRPQVSDVLRQITAFLGAVDKRFVDAQLENIEQITNAVEHIRKVSSRLKASIDYEKKQYTDLVGSTMDSATRLGGKIDPKFYRDWKARNIDFSLFQTLVFDLPKKLAEDVAKPLRHFKVGQARPESWNAVLRRQRADSLYAEAVNYFQLLSRYTSKDGNNLKIIYTILSSDPEGQQHIAKTEAAYKRLTGELVAAVTEYGQFFIQQRLSEVFKQADNLLEYFFCRVEQALQQEQVANQELTKAILAGKRPPPLIETLVETEFKSSGETAQDREDQWVLEMKVAPVKTAVKKTANSIRSWWRKKVSGKSTEDLDFTPIMKEDYVEKAHTVSTVFSGEGIEQNANLIFRNHADDLQKKLLDWLRELLENYADELEYASTKLTETLIASLEKQAAQTRVQRLKEIAQWQRAGEKIKDGHRELEKLKTWVEEKGGEINVS